MFHDGPDLFRSRSLTALTAALLAFSASTAFAADSLSSQTQGPCPENYTLILNECIWTGINDGPDPVGGKQATGPKNPTVTDDPDPMTITEDIVPFSQGVVAAQVAQTRLILVPGEGDEFVPHYDNTPMWDPTCDPTACYYRIDAACWGNNSWAKSAGVVDFGGDPVACEGKCANGMTITIKCPTNRRAPTDV